MLLKLLTILALHITLTQQANSEFARCVQGNCLALADQCLPDCLKDHQYVKVNRVHPRCTRNSGKRITFPNFDLDSYMICLDNIIAATTNSQLKAWLQCEKSCSQNMLLLPIMMMLMMMAFT